MLAADNHRLVVSADGDGAIPDLVAALVGAGARVHLVVPEEPTLEEAYLELVRRGE